MKNWFLYRVYKLNKGLFVFFIFVLAGTLFTNLLGWQATPFFVWGMYSGKEDSSNNRQVVKITVNDSSVIHFTSYTDANRFFLTSPLQLYILMKKTREDPTELFLKRKLDNYSAIQPVGEKVLNDSTEYNSFLMWYKRYLEQTTGLTINSYKIELLKTALKGKNKSEAYSTELIDTWKQ